MERHKIQSLKVPTLHHQPRLSLIPHLHCFLSIHTITFLTMSTFTRIAVFTMLMLWLSYLVSAIPVSRMDDKIPAITNTNAVSLVCAKLFVGIEVKINALRKLCSPPN